MKNRLLFASLISILFFFISCGETNELNPSFKSVENGEELVALNNKFALDVFKNIAENEDKENYMISPVSLSLALAMTYNGAENETKSAFENTLNYTSFLREEINTINKEISTNISKGSLFEIANSIWINKSITVKENFITTNSNYYNATVEKLNFDDANSVNIINDWVSDKTNKKIPKIIDEIKPNDVLFLINALYFKSDWKYQFKKENTLERPFYGKNNTKKVQMMQINASFNIYENDNFTAVKLPYKNDKYVMTVLLPKDGKNIKDISNSLNKSNWENWNGSFSSREVQLSMPKFTFSYEKRLNNTLIDLGLGNAFSRSADFGAISNMPLSISFVVQKTFIEVNEKGTEAAAVTAVGIGITSTGPSNKTVNLNKPFLFAITEKETNSICFIGKVGMPNN